jgi:hypothetical protein
MGQRKIEKISKQATIRNDDELKEITVDVNYPRPVPLSKVIEDVAGWSDVNFVMEPGLNKSIQIFAPRPMSKEQGFSLFIASLETIGLRAVMLDGQVAKIVSYGLGKVSV